MQQKRLQLQKLCGVDFAHHETDTAPMRSPNSVNMMRSVPGKIRKRMGYQKIAEYGGRINGRYQLGEHEIIHAGEKLYYDGGLIYANMNNAPSQGFCYKSKLYLLDGKNYFAIENGMVYFVHSFAKLPQITVSRNPNGSGGSLLESVNLLSSGWTDGFYGTETGKTYQLSFSDLNFETVHATILQEDGITKTEYLEGNGFSVDRKTGVVTFAQAPGKSPIEGQDNVWITAYRDISHLRQRIEQSKVYAAYGEIGRGLRIFMTGCSQYLNRDFWSEADDPTYFPDLNYSVLGEDSAGIMGYSILGDSIAAHKGDPEGKIYIRKGELTEETDASGNVRQNLVFRTGSVLNGQGVIASKSFATLGNETLFLTKRGVCALTATDLTGEKYEQIRSFYVNDRLNAQEQPEEAQAVVYRDFYLLAFPTGTVYLLDGLQKDYSEEEPHSSFQYECFVWENIPSTCLWVDQGVLCFGDGGGTVYRFYTDEDDPNSYRDVQTPVEAFWQIPDLNGSLFYKPKTFRRCSVCITGARETSVLGEYRKPGGTWVTIMESSGKGCYFDFSNLTFSKMTFRCDSGPCTVDAKLGIHRVQKAGFRFLNQKAEPFGLETIAFEYLE